MSTRSNGRPILIGAVLGNSLIFAKAGVGASRIKDGFGIDQRGALTCAGVSTTSPFTCLVPINGGAASHTLIRWLPSVVFGVGIEQNFGAFFARAAAEAGLLSQWRSYARGGFAIEFDEFGIDELNKEETAGWRYHGMITNTVAYENHEARVKPEKFKGMAGAFLRTILPSSPQLNEILGAASIDEFGRSFLSVAPFLKHFGFKEEAEYRIVALCNRPTKSDRGEKRAIKEIRFRSRQDGNVIPYIALYEGLRKPLPIKSVIVGPHAQQENQRVAVELLLERYGINARVRVSGTPFRE
jgi:hypothetical protein